MVRLPDKAAVPFLSQALPTTGMSKIHETGGALLAQLYENCCSK